MKFNFFRCKPALRRINWRSNTSSNTSPVTESTTACIATASICASAATQSLQKSISPDTPSSLTSHRTLNSDSVSSRRLESPDQQLEMDASGTGHIQTPGAPLSSMSLLDNPGTKSKAREIGISTANAVHQFLKLGKESTDNWPIAKGVFAALVWIIETSQVCVCLHWNPSSVANMYLNDFSNSKITESSGKV